nr:ABC transporter ATP-binding protein [Kiloniellales bacterium]
GVLLISEDLDEILALADRVAVIHAGRVGPALEVGSVTARELGAMMAGDLGYPNEALAEAGS